MRPITTEALNYLSTTKGLEPINVVEITWVDTPYLYADRSFEQELLVKGAILELSDLENVINFAGSSNSQTISLKLDDIDGELKAIYDFNDIHKRPVKIYQWFHGLNLSDKFLIFEGVINSPIVWDEGDRTLSFEVISKLEDNEVGFSVEEGEFTNIPDFLVGRAWPLPFGTCLKVPTIRIDPIPTGIQLDGTGISDPTLTDQLLKLNGQGINLNAAARAMFAGALASYHTAQEIAQDTNPEYDATNKDTWDESFVSLGDQYTEKGNEYLAQFNVLNEEITALTIAKRDQKTQEKDRLTIHDGERFPQNTPIQVYLGGALHSGEMSGNDFVIAERVHPEINIQAVDVDTVLTRGTFFWAKGGSGFKLASALPVRYIVSMIPVTVLNVFARRNFGDIKKVMAVPPNLYSVSNDTFGSIVATIITLVKPLSSVSDQWEDELWVDLVSPIGPNTVQIIEWLISTYTELSIDTVSFGEVETILEDYPSNFCLLDRKNIIELLSDIAYQSRCAIWLNNGTFYLKYLPLEPDPDDSITLSDILTNSLSISSSSTEEIITKLVARYRTTYLLDEFKFIFRHNIAKYGVQEEDIDWFIYNHPNLVNVAATYWLIQKANTWKILRFRTPLHKLRLEPFDTVSINIASVASEEVTGRILTVAFDSESRELEFEVWLPVRLGETTAYEFAYLVDSAVLLFPKLQDDAGSIGPGRQATGNLAPVNKAQFQDVMYPMISVAPPTISFGNPIDYGNPTPGTAPNAQIQILSVPGHVNSSAAPTFDYGYGNYTPSAFTGGAAVVPKTVPGKVISGDGPEYVVETYEKGRNNPPTMSRNVRDINFKSKTKAGTWVSVAINVFKEGDTYRIEKTFSSAPLVSGCLPGYIVSGSGDTYQVKVFRNGLAGEFDTISAKQLKIDPGSIIKEGMGVLVSVVEKENGQNEYTIQHAIFDRTP